MSLANHDRVKWVRAKTDNRKEMWWPALLYQNFSDFTASVSNDTSVFSQLFVDLLKNNAIEKPLAFFTGPFPLRKRYIVIESEDVDEVVLPFYENVSRFLKGDKGIQAAMEGVAKILTCNGKISVSDIFQNGEVKQNQDISVMSKRQSQKGQKGKRKKQTKNQEKKTKNKVNDEEDKQELDTNSEFEQNDNEDLAQDCDMSCDKGHTDLMSRDSSVGTSSTDSTIHSSDPVKTMWDKLRLKGWTFKTGRGLIDYYYIPPNGSINGVLNKDYFTEIDEIFRFVKNKPVKDENGNERISRVAPKIGQNKSKEAVVKGSSAKRNPKAEGSSKNQRKEASILPSKNILKEDKHPGGKETNTAIIKSGGHLSGDDDGQSVPDTSTVFSDKNSIAPTDSWKVVWEKLRAKGWYFRPGSGTTYFYYVPPNGNIKGVENRDFFTSLESLQEYIQANTCWNAEILQILPDNLVFPEGLDFLSLWRQLKDFGWEVQHRGTSLYFVIPKHNVRSGVKGEHYFCTEEEVMQFVRAKMESSAPVTVTTNTVKQDNKKSAMKRKVFKSKVQVEHSRKNNNNKIRKNVPMQTSSSPTTGEKMLGCSSVFDLGDLEVESLDNLIFDDSQRLSHSGEILSLREAVSVIQKVFGVRFKKNFYFMPGKDPAKKDTYQAGKDFFRTAESLRRYICAYGISVLNSSIDLKLADEDRRDLERFFALTHVPLLKDVVPEIQPLSDADALSILQKTLVIGETVNSIQFQYNSDNTTFALEPNEQIPSSFEGIEELKAFICRFGVKSKMWSDVEELKISLWAADSSNLNFFNETPTDEEKGIGNNGQITPSKGKESNSTVTDSRQNSGCCVEVTPTETHHKSEDYEEDLPSKFHHIVDDSLPSPGHTVSKVAADSITSSTIGIDILDETYQIQIAKERMENIIYCTPVGEPVRMEDEWPDVWEKMKLSGWVEKFGSGLQNSIFLPPHGNPRGTRGINYFETEYDLKKFAYKHFGWRGPKSYRFFPQSEKDRGHRRNTRKRSSNATQLYSSHSPNSQSLCPKTVPSTPSSFLKRKKTEEETPSTISTASVVISQTDTKRKCLSNDSIKNNLDVVTEKPPNTVITKKNSDQDSEVNSPVEEEEKMFEIQDHHLNAMKNSSTDEISQHIIDVAKRQTVDERLRECLKMLSPGFEGKRYVSTAPGGNDASVLSKNSGYVLECLSSVKDSIITGQSLTPQKILYAFGCPGSGKSSTLTLCCKEFSLGVSCGFKVNTVYVNAGQAQGPDDLTKKIGEAFQLSPFAPPHVIERRLKSNKSLTVMLLDEADLILRSGNKAVNQIVNWATNPEYNFFLILISNKLESARLKECLPSGFLIHSKNHLVFPSYNKTDLYHILKTRAGENVFEESALNYISTKVESSGGDARRALEIASASVTQCINSLSQIQKDNPFSVIDSPLIGFKHVRLALSDLEDYNPLEAIARLPLNPKIMFGVITALSSTQPEKKVSVTMDTLKNLCLAAVETKVFENLGMKFFNDALDTLNDRGLVNLIAPNESGEPHGLPIPSTIQLSLKIAEAEYALDAAFPQEGFYRRLSENVVKIYVSKE